MMNRVTFATGVHKRCAQATWRCVLPLGGAAVPDLVIRPILGPLTRLVVACSCAYLFGRLRSITNDCGRLRSITNDCGRLWKSLDTLQNSLSRALRSFRSCV